MKKVLVVSILISFFSFDKEPEYLTRSAIEQDLAFFDEFLQNNSSYQGLNGYNYKKDFDAFLEGTKDSAITKVDFGMFLTTSIGKIGDRHAYVRGDQLPNNLFLPFIVAPIKNKVIALEFDQSKTEYRPLYPEYPFLKSINTAPINDFLKRLRPKDVKAPKAAFQTRAVKELKYMERNYAVMDKKPPKEFLFTFTNGNTDTIVKTSLESKRSKYKTWDERFARLYGQEKEELNNLELCKSLLRIDEDNIAYARLPSMVHSRDAPIFFKYFNRFFQEVKNSKALIIDVRSNGGGTRDLIRELAGYLVHPDSIHVVNVAKQRCKLPLSEHLKRSLHRRFLFSKEELDSEEQNAVKKFMAAFSPMYTLDDKKFSQYHFYVLNGKKISNNKYHYDKPVYILANERSFSAASILVSVFKGLPNVNIVGVNTDGSSGNSVAFRLPNSKIEGKISTMVSYQKNGKILDGVGTEPDIVIERNIDQVLWKKDYQLDRLKDIINAEPNDN
ncbi:S41 family peptidase [Flagellimonas sp. HMM57]|uniref:S41 family peptidase n=1 Tax=unclassified Flagellimonas TaxID=2644544 RepID=UPI0013D09C04|nr:MULTISPECIES: S41 family peptidase [unclassified Flagellimonas]UII77651.1 S41 family peptidase [Flagellimonas sp. HMM57]